MPKDRDLLNLKEKHHRTKEMKNKTKLLLLYIFEYLHVDKPKMYRFKSFKFENDAITFLRSSVLTCDFYHQSHAMPDDAFLIQTIQSPLKSNQKSQNIHLFLL